MRNCLKIIPFGFLLFTICDSSMANKKPEVAPETGWCQAFPAFVDQSVIIKNRAVNGRSTKSFIAEGRKDNTHLCVEGANLMAKLAAQQLKQLGNSLSQKIK
jgi:lysophospholipase L1-like esterase